MIINNDLNKTAKPGDKKKGKILGAGFSSAAKNLFQSEFQNAIDEVSEKNFPDQETILEELRGIETRLIGNPSSANFFEYQSFIKEISSKLMKGAFKLVQFRDNRKKQYEYLRTIDQGMKEIYSLILKKDQNKEKIANLMGSIRGIILDMTA